MYKKLVYLLIFVGLIFVGCQLLDTLEKSEGPKVGEAYRTGESISAVFFPTNYAYVDVPVEGTVLAQIDDPMFDDYGNGTYVYPNHPSYYKKQGAHLNDINQVIVSSNSSYLIFYIALPHRSAQYWYQNFYLGTSPYKWLAGFDHLFVGIWLSDGDTTGANELYVNAPADGTPGELLVKAYTELPWDMALWAIGNAVDTNNTKFRDDPRDGTPIVALNGGIIAHYTAGRTAKSNRYEFDIDFTTNAVWENVKIQIEDTVIETNTIKLPNTIVFKIPWSVLTNHINLANGLYFIITTWDWEDYGLTYYDNENPGINGHLRPIDTYPGDWTYGAGNKLAKIMDLVCNPNMSQTDILSTKTNIAGYDGAFIPKKAWIKIW